MGWDVHEGIVELGQLPLVGGMARKVPARRLPQHVIAAVKMYSSAASESECREERCTERSMSPPSWSSVRGIVPSASGAALCEEKPSEGRKGGAFGGMELRSGLTTAEAAPATRARPTTCCTVLREKSTRPSLGKSSKL